MRFIEINQETSKTYLNLKEICAIKEMDGGTRICMNNGKIFDAKDPVADILKQIEFEWEDQQ